MQSRDYFDLEAKQRTLDELTLRLENPKIWENPTEANKIIQHRNQIKPAIRASQLVKQVLDNLTLAIEMVRESSEFITEAELNAQKANDAVQSLEKLALFSGEFDSSNCYLKIQAGAGGKEAADWAYILRRMYLKFCIGKNLKATIVDEAELEGGGLKYCTLFVEGELAYGWLKGEQGVHRLTRNSPFSADLKKHTSFAGIDVFPEIPEVEVNIDWNKDVREDTYRAGGPGGQHVNRTESAIRLTHLPSGIVTQCQSGRSQHQNRATARQQLISKLYQHQKNQRNETIATLYGNKSDMAFGSQIRSYKLDDNRVKDHRTNYEEFNPQTVFDGKLDEFVNHYLKLVNQN